MVYKVTSNGIIHSNNTGMFKCSSVTVIKLNENGSFDKSNLHNYISRLNVYVQAVILKVQSHAYQRHIMWYGYLIYQD